MGCVIEFILGLFRLLYQIVYYSILVCIKFWYILLVLVILGMLFLGGAK